MHKLIVFIFFITCFLYSPAQPKQPLLLLTSDSLGVVGLSGKELSLFKLAATSLPLVSYKLNEKQYSTADANAQLDIRLSNYRDGAKGVNAIITFTNLSGDTVHLENIVPFGENAAHVYITGKGKHGLSRTHLFTPGRNPVNVIVPDNAWDLGYASLHANDNSYITALVRRDRTSIRLGTRGRFDTHLYPGGSVAYTLYAEKGIGDWRDALRHVFQERMLYDMETFDNSLFERADLRWIRHTYVHHLMMAWDKFYYDYKDNQFHIDDFLARGRKLYGGDEIISIWPTWPTLGLDQRNQFDLFRDLPGGTPQLKKLATESRINNTRFFICYNPWDESTRSEDHFKGLSDLIKATTADGVILDTRGGSSKELQDAADHVKKGVVMYSEGMAVPKDMSGIVSGRVHNALYYAPMLNLNKLIKPEFTIYRVAELYKERIQREFATSFFNGYGTEINIMSPGQPDWVNEQYRYLGRTSRILRENTHNFLSPQYTPLISTTAESIWVNKWPGDQKTIYTIYCVRPAGYNGLLFEVEPEPGYHFVDLWHHRLLEPVSQEDKWMIRSETDAFNQAHLGTNNEGEVDAIAKLPLLLKPVLNGDRLDIGEVSRGDELLIWAGNPSYEKAPLKLKPGKHTIRLHEHFGRFEGNFIIQLMDEGILLDETIVTIRPGDSRLVSETIKTAPAATAPKGMVAIPSGSFTFKATQGDQFISYPRENVGKHFVLSLFYMDRYPVTNAQFSQFIKATGYKPSDTANYLKHWINKSIPVGQNNFPVVYVSYEDAKAYARWAGKRLPAEVEWQYAAQTPAMNEWPWKQEIPVRRKLQEVTENLTVSAIEGIDSSKCNLGDGKPYSVGKYPAGANPYGLNDLVGCVWQLTNDEYMSGSYRYLMLKGGSYFKPSSSWWYVQGGPRELHYRQFLLRVSQGFERNGTVGFRCVKDGR